jgi:PAP2 superfamily protein
MSPRPYMQYAETRICLSRHEGATYPLATLVVVLGTANHWLLDAVGAFATMAVAYQIRYLLLTAQRPFAAARTPLHEPSPG